MDGESLGYTSLDVAKWFINATDRESGDAITHLKVQKLLYFAQGWALVVFGRPLFDEDMEAWAHGPVAPSVWRHFKGYRFDAIPDQKITRRISGDVASLLSSVLDRYGIYSAKKLEQMTHGDPPWRTARGDLPVEARCNAVIPKAAIRDHFRSLHVHAA